MQAFLHVGLFQTAMNVLGTMEAVPSTLTASTCQEATSVFVRKDSKGTGTPVGVSFYQWLVSGS